VAYSSSDLTHPIASYQQQTQFAVGGLFGYDFGPLTLQAYATTDVGTRVPRPKKKLCVGHLLGRAKKGGVNA